MQKFKTIVLSLSTVSWLLQTLTYSSTLPAEDVASKNLPMPPHVVQHHHSTKKYNLNYKAPMVTHPVKTEAENQVPGRSFLNGDPSANTLSVFQENQLGKQIILEVMQELPVNFDPLVSEYINRLGARLVAAGHIPNRQFHFFVINTDDINAFALPGGYICINSGLIQNTNSENELAAVMAHEIAHVRQRHIARMMESAKSATLPMLAGIVAAVLAGIAGSGDAAMGALSATMTAGAAHMMSFSRHEEQEADNVGMRILYNAGFDPNAMPGFFGKMQQAQLQYGAEQVPSIFMNHPSTPIRIAEAQARANTFPHQKAVSSEDYYFIKQRLSIQPQKNKIVLIEQYQKNLKSGSMINKDNYGYALALLENHQIKAGLSVIEKLYQTDTHNIFVSSLYAQLLAENKQADRALDVIHAAQKNFPNSIALILQSAKILYLAGKLAAAAAVVNDALLDYPGNVSLYHLLAQIQSDQKKYALATESEAEARALSWQLQAALDILEPLQHDQSLGYYDRLRIQGKVERLKKAIKRQKYLSN